MRRKPVPEGDIRFDPELEVSPFALFRSFKEGRPPVLIDVGPAPGKLSFARVPPRPEPAEGQTESPPEDDVVVLFDADGTTASEIARRLQAVGFSRVRSLFGGLALYDFSLDPAVVGDERFLNRPSTSSPISKVRR
jgi:hypothetical protein